MTARTPDTPDGRHVTEAGKKTIKGDCVNLAIIDLLLDCRNFGPESFAARELRHEDGRPFTEEEHQLVGQATRAELLAVHDFHVKATEAARDQAENLRLLAELVKPYMERFGPDTTVADVRALMPAEQRAQLDELVARASDAAWSPRDRQG